MMEANKLTGWHTFNAEAPPFICAACCESFPTLAAAAATVCETRRLSSLAKCQSAIYAIKEVLALKHEKVTPVSGPDAGKRIKQPIDATEKLVRICAALHALLPDDLKEAIDDEARNRLFISHATQKAPWK